MAQLVKTIQGVAIASCKTVQGTAIASVKSILGVDNTGGGGGGFDPDSITGLVAWLKADAIVGLANADPVPTWEDSGSTNNDFAQGTSGSRPTYRTSVLNGLPVVRFDGTDDFMTASSSPIRPCTVFVVGRPAAGGSNDYQPFIIGPNLIQLCARLSSANWGTYCDSELSAGEALSTSNFSILRIMNALSAATSIWRDGVQKATRAETGQGGSASMRIGGDGSTRPLSCDIAEVLVYDTVLSQANYEAVEDYLGAKYAITVP